MTHIPEKTIDDWELIEKAQNNEDALLELRHKYSPLVERIAQNYVDKTDASKEELIEVGWTYFEFSVERYYKRMSERIENEKNVYQFSTYFQGNVRMSIETYLGISEVPLTRIVRRDGSQPSTLEMLVKARWWQLRFLVRKYVRKIFKR